MLLLLVWLLGVTWWRVVLSRSLLLLLFLIRSLCRQRLIVVLLLLPYHKDGVPLSVLSGSNPEYSSSTILLLLIIPIPSGIILLSEICSKCVHTSLDLFNDLLDLGGDPCTASGSGNGIRW